MEKQKPKKSMEVQPTMEYVFGSLGVYWIKKKKMKWNECVETWHPWGVWVVDDCETPFLLTKKNETSISFVTSVLKCFFLGWFICHIL